MHILWLNEGKAIKWNPLPRHEKQNANQFVFRERSVFPIPKKIVFDLEFRWIVVRSRISTWTQIETRTAFQLWSSGLISKLRLQTTQVWLSVSRCRIPRSDNTLNVWLHRVMDYWGGLRSPAYRRRPPLNSFWWNILPPKYSKNPLSLYSRIQTDPNFPAILFTLLLRNHVNCTFLIDQNPNRENKMLIFLCSCIFSWERW